MYLKTETNKSNKIYITVLCAINIYLQSFNYCIVTKTQYIISCINWRHSRDKLYNMYTV